MPMTQGPCSSLPYSWKRRQLLIGGLGSLLLSQARGAGKIPVAPSLSASCAFVGNLNETLYAKNADTPVPIASVSKLMTALVILSSELPLAEKIRIEPADATLSGNTQSHLAIGSSWSRTQLLEWLLVVSDNRAAAALARSIPGGWPEFKYAMRMLATQMQLFSFDFGDASGLSAINRASARDLGILLTLLAQQPGFRALSTKTSVGNATNINRFAHDRSVALLTGKTGFTSAAGYCLAQAEQFGDQTFALVVLHARDKDSRAADMNALRAYTRRLLTG